MDHHSITFTKYEDWRKWFNPSNPIFLSDTKTLQLKNRNDVAIAHIQAQKGWITNNPEALKIVNGYGQNTAQIQIDKGWKTEDFQLLKLMIGHISIAYIQTQIGWVPKDTKILQIKNESGSTVETGITRYNLSKRPHLLSIQEIEYYKTSIDVMYTETRGKTNKQIKQWFRKQKI